MFANVWVLCRWLSTYGLLQNQDFTIAVQEAAVTGNAEMVLTFYEGPTANSDQINQQILRALADAGQDPSYSTAVTEPPVAIGDNQTLVIAVVVSVVVIVVVVIVVIVVVMKNKNKDTVQRTGGAGHVMSPTRAKTYLGKPGADTGTSV
jgi:hypothetical protein